MKRLIITTAFIFIALSLLAKQPKSDSYNNRGFAWGIDIGSSIDISSNGMSSIDADAFFGYKNKFINIIGIGAAVHQSLGNNNTLIPVYLIFRTNFRTRPSLCFFDLRGGYSFNSLESKQTQDGLFGSVGIGFNLYSSSKFNSHIILSYNYSDLKSYTIDDKVRNLKDLQSMSIRIGIRF
ncbi:MAG: hypothetical protein PHR45_06770 [Muribaculaceae bacterium]|nr:hypothetical protein [Muribaculaceae bacterium]